MSIEMNAANVKQIVDISTAVEMINADIEDATQAFSKLSEADVLVFVEEHHLEHLIVGAEFVTGWLCEGDTEDECLILTNHSFIEICVGTEERARVMYTTYPFELTNETFASFKSNMSAGSVGFNAAEEFQIGGWCDEYITYAGHTATLYINRDYGAFHTEASVYIVGA